MTLSRPEVLRLLEDNRISPSRALGQNFVADPNTVRRIARLAGVGPGDHVVEIGAGLGSLTLALAETGASVVAVERDRWLVPVLKDVLAARAPGAPVRVVEADAMTLDWSALLGAGTGWALVANLPYNVATPLVADLLDKVPAVQRMLVMVQREVGQRLVAPPGDPAHGAVSVKVAYWAEAALVGTVPSSVFVPQPRVGSALVSLKRRDEPLVGPSVVPAPELFRVVRAGFAQRRKMLRRALAGLNVSSGVFAAAGIDGQARAEQLSVEDWGRLAAAIAASVGPVGSVGA
ncbi:MAG: 16S rRNA (adenine(1518)-N(6)/adenine(1519)-N(6))-dimethyltransferase RsmA [Acidimicrobiales bacterium]